VASTVTAPPREAERPPVEPVRRLHRVPVWAWLVALVALSVLVRYAFSRRIVAPWILQDELIYSELAKSLAEHGQPRVRDEPYIGAFGLLYPLLIAPAYLLHESLVSAYATVKLINGIAFSLAAVPVYFLARRVLTPPFALLAAGLSLAVPGALYAGMIMTENLFYPLVATAVLALVLVLERPSPLRVGILFAVLFVAFQARAQTLVFGPVVLTAPLLLAAFERSWARGLVRFRWLYGAAAAALAGIVLMQAVRGQSLLDLIGAYRPVGEAGYDLGQVARWTVYHVAHLDLAVGVLPFAVFLLMISLAPRLGPREQAFFAAATALTVFMVLQVSAFASRFILRVEERNMFHVLPLVIIALLLWVELGLPRPHVRTLAAAGAALLLPLAVPFEQILDVSATSDTFSLLFWWDLVVWFQVPHERLWIPAFASAVVLVLVFGFLPRRLRLAAPALMLAAFALYTYSAESRAREAALGSLFTGLTHPDRDWIDRAVGADARVAAIWTARLHWTTVTHNEFFNRAVGPVYTFEQPMPFHLPQKQLLPDYDTGRVPTTDGRQIDAEYALFDDHTPIAGTVIARDETKGMNVVRIERPLRLEHASGGIYGDGWSGRTFWYRRFECDGGSVQVSLMQDPKLISEPQEVVARMPFGRVLARYTVRPDREISWMRVPLRPNIWGMCPVQFEVRPSAIPARVQPGSTDPRRLGLRIGGFTHFP
jgi:hypothetical protein